MSKSYRSDNSQERLLRPVFICKNEKGDKSVVTNLLLVGFKVVSENLSSDNYVKCSVPSHKRNDITKTVSGK